MASLKLQNVYKVYDGGVRAVSDFSLDIKDKEFVVFVGPSGCGKSTTLRMIAGLEEITSGDLLMDGVKLNDVQPKDRNVAMVFQNYALYPHMSVFQNMAFGLKLRKLPKEEIEARVKRAAKILGIEDLLDRKPKALSGGQRQRVALGRAIVREPSVFLLDEPLSNLDAKLRVQMRTEITKLHKKLATTFIYVTHDQTEAMTMGDRIVVMKDGFIQQADTPATLYEQPANVFVATFLGSPQMNVIPAELRAENGLKVVFGNNYAAEFSPLKAKQLSDSKYIGQSVLFGIRPENITLAKEGIPAVVDAVEHLGSETIVFALVEGLENPIIVKMPVDHSIVIGLNVNLSFNTEKSQLFDQATSLAIMGVPTVNVLPCTLTPSVVRLNGSEIQLPEYFKKRLFAHAYSACQSINVRTEKILLSPTEESLQIDGVVDFVVENSDNDSVYLRTPVKDGYFVIHTAKKATKAGESVSIYLPYDAIGFVDENGVRLNSVFEVSENVGECTVKLDGDVACIKIGKKTLRYSGLNVKEGRYRIRLISDKLSFAYSKNYAKKNKIEAGSSECSLPAKSYDEDKLGGGKNAVFVCVPGFENYLSVILDDKFSVYKMPDFPLVIPKDGFELIPIE